MTTAIMINRFYHGRHAKGMFDYFELLKDFITPYDGLYSPHGPTGNEHGRNHSGTV
jgi:hypothetical protein